MASKTVLVVEDNELNMKLLTQRQIDEVRNIMTLAMSYTLLAGR